MVVYGDALFEQSIFINKDKKEFTFQFKNNFLVVLQMCVITGEHQTPKTVDLPARRRLNMQNA